MKGKVRNRHIFISGHKGMVGSALVRRIEKEQNVSLVLRDRLALDLLDQAVVQAFFETNELDEVYLSAARVGGIWANEKQPANFIYENLMIAANIINAAHEAGVKKLMFFGSSCIYPKHANQPIKESALLTGPLEPTNSAYALAKISGIALCEAYSRQYGRDYRAVMPTNLYGPNDNFHSENSHVIPGLMRRFHDAKQSAAASVTVWGSGSPLREFMHVDDLADAAVHVMQLSSSEYQKVVRRDSPHINVGTGQECTIADLAREIANLCGFDGKIIFDASKPDGAPRKLMDSSRLKALGWCPAFNLPDGLRATYSWYQDHLEQLRT